MSVEKINDHWFLAQLKPNSFRIAERNLQRQGFDTFLPLYKCKKNVRGKIKASLEPLFPGYVFVAFDPASGGWSAINATSGVTRLVSFGNVPATVPKELVLQLIQHFENQELPQKSHNLEQGDNVRLVTGPFTDFITKIEAIEPDQRVWVLIDLMGRPTRVAVDAANLRRI